MSLVVPARFAHRRHPPAYARSEFRAGLYPLARGAERGVGFFMPELAGLCTRILENTVVFVQANHFLCE